MQVIFYLLIFLIPTLFIVGLIKPTLLGFRKLRFHSRKQVTLIFFITAFILLTVMAIYGSHINSEGVKNSVTLYSKSQISIFKCPQETCEKIETLPKFSSWNIGQSHGDWLQVASTNGQQGFIKNIDLTDEVPIKVVLKKPINGYACPSLKCNLIPFPPQEMWFFKSEVQEGWYLLGYTDFKTKKLSNVFFPKNIIEDKPSNTSKKPMALQVPKDANQSGPPVKLYAKSYSKVFSCQSETCGVIDEIQPVTYWDLSFTPKGEWFNTLTKDNKSGYVKLANLISEKDFPKRCTIPLPYSIGYVSQKFIENGFDKTRIAMLTQRAVEEWENALGLKLFRYSQEETHNLINSRTYSYQVSDNHAWGTAFPNSLPNGTVLAFEIAVYEKIFDYYNKLSSDFYVNVSKDKFLENEILRVLIHELGHTIGFQDHIPGSQNIMFSGYGNPEEEPKISFEEWEKKGKTPPKLTGADISAIKNWCSSN